MKYMPITLRIPISSPLALILFLPNLTFPIKGKARGVLSVCSDHARRQEQEVSAYEI
jgi:hypothetical protein